MKIKCAIFDFDGTLFDSMFVWKNVGEIYLQTLGKEPKAFLNEKLKTLSLYQSAAYLQREYNLLHSIEEIMTGINQIIQDFYFHQIKPKPGVISFLENMQRAQIQMGIATASESYQVKAALKRCKMQHFFDAIFTCTEVGFGKDEPVIFRVAMEYFNANRGNTMIFEDALHAVKTAKKDGFIVTSVFDSSEIHQKELQSLSDYHITDFTNTNYFEEIKYEVKNCINNCRK